MFDLYARESGLLSGGVQGSLVLKCARNGRKFREGQGERELLPSARCEHIVCSCQQIGAPWPSTCLGMRQSQRLQPTTDSLQHTREVNRSSHAYIALWLSSADRIRNHLRLLVNQRTCGIQNIRSASRWQQKSHREDRTQWQDKPTCPHRKVV